MEISEIGKLDSLEAFENIKPILNDVRKHILYIVYNLGECTYKEVVSVYSDSFENRSTVTARLSEFKKWGWVEPTTTKRDGCRAVKITEKGKQVLGAI